MSFKCTLENCNKVFVSKNNLDRHVKQQHETEKIECPKCGKFIRRVDNLINHMKTKSCEKNTMKRKFIDVNKVKKPSFKVR